MARNRKRAKERRARRPEPVASRQRDGRGPRAVPPERDAALEQAEQEVVPGPTSARPHELAPDPLQHAAPDVELADEHIAFGSPALADEEIADEDFGREQAVVEEELADQRQRRAGTAGPVSHERASLYARLIGFLQGSWRELQRVQWPDRRQVAQATGVVIGFVIVAGVFLGLCDLAFSHLVNFILK